MKGSSVEDPILMRSPEPPGGLLSYIIENFADGRETNAYHSSWDAKRYNDMGARLTGC